ncbi:MAG: hypothetical protein AB1414_08795 [bacterium]
MDIIKLKNNTIVSNVSKQGLKSTIIIIILILGLLIVIRPTTGEGISATQEVFLRVAERLFQPTKQEFASRTIKLDPFMLEKTIYGKSYSFPIRVYNLINLPQQIQVYPTQLGQELDGSHLFITDPWWGTKLIDVNPSNFTLDSKEAKIVKVEFRTPEKITGGFYTAIVFEATPINNKSVKSAVILAFTLPGELKREGKISDISFLQNKPGQPIIILLRFVNTGNIHLRLHGNVTIKNPFGVKIAKLEIGSEVVLPNYPHQITLPFRLKDLAVGTYTAEANIKIEDGEPVELLTTFMVIRPNEIGIIKLEIISFTIPIAVWNRPIYFNLLAFNAGNTNLTTTGEITIKNSGGEIIATTPFEKETIPAGSSKELKAVLKEGLPIGSYTACASVEYEGKRKVATQNFWVIEKALSQEGKILEFIIPTTQANKPIIPELVLKNTCEIPIYVEGMIEIIDSQRNVISEIPIARVELEPEMIQNLGKRSELKLLPGEYLAIVTLVIGGKQVITQETSFLITGNWLNGNW